MYAIKSSLYQLIGVVFLSLMAGCAVHQPGRTFKPPQVYRMANADLTGEEAQRYQILKRHYSLWAGTPYRYGGNSNRGIDCSAYMKRVFADSFKTTLPRTTIQQVNVGDPVAQSQLQVGDLIFFKTGWNKRHVGVFMGDSRFLHASESKGVTISALNTPYWSSRFWQSRRVL